MNNLSVQHDSETPAKGQQVITAVAVVHTLIDGQHKIFLPRRAKTKKFLPDVFELPGGHIDFGEDLEEGLKREIMEELGMRIEIEEVIGAFTYTNNIKGSHSVEIIYLAKFVDPINKIKIHPEDHSGYRWVTADEVEALYNETSGTDDPEYQYVLKAFNLIGEGA